MDRRVAIRKAEEAREPRISRSRSQSSEEEEKEEKLRVVHQSKGVAVVQLNKGESLKFQGAMQVRVLHGQVSLLGALLGEGQWHSVTSDPRKNMLLDIKNCSKSEEARVLSKRFDGVEYELENVSKKASTSRSQSSGLTLMLRNNFSCLLTPWGLETPNHRSTRGRASSQ
jgi:hypothetical protein